MGKPTVSDRISQPKTQRGKRHLLDRAPKLTENDKSCLFIRGGNTSLAVTQCLKDLYQIRRLNSSFLKQKNPFHPFVDDTPLEKFSQKYDASLFVFGSHQKKTSE